MILTDLNIDCLEDILEYLELVDLLSAADSNKRLRHASKFVFLQKYGSYQFAITESATNEISELKKIKLVESCILKYSLQLVRIFGSLISRIKCINKTNPYICDYIHEFCSETLRDIETSDLDYFKRPFTSVETVYIRLFLTTTRTLDENSLKRIFPRIRGLTMRTECEHLHAGCIAKHFPFLEYFYLNTYWSTRDNKCAKVIETFFRLNPQLKHLRLKCKNRWDIYILRKLQKCAPSLECLHLDTGYNFFNIFNEKKVHLKTVKYLIIDGTHYKIDVIPFSFDKLESLELLVNLKLIEGIYDFFQNNSSIKKLTIRSDLHPIDYSRLVKSLPLLEEITVRKDYGLSIDIVLHVITMFKSLKYFCFWSYDACEYRQLQARLNDGWSMQLKTVKYRNHVILKRGI